MHKKLNLPEKNCVTCGRPFSWRKKWERVWDDVKYCSNKCRMQKLKPQIGEHLYVKRNRCGEPSSMPLEKRQEHQNLATKFMKH